VLLEKPFELCERDAFAVERLELDLEFVRFERAVPPLRELDLLRLFVCALRLFV
jgi:hypothetical protein